VTTKVVMPQAGQDLETALVKRWLKSEADSVTKGETIVEVEAEKVALEAEAPVSGTILWILAPEGTDAPILSTICVIGEPGEDVSSIT
jgi:pyruvate dehydrogenase E2 component (dihydrolipoamide acetyltransferase)